MKKKLNKILISCSSLLLALITLFVVGYTCFIQNNKLIPPIESDSSMTNRGNKDNPGNGDNGESGSLEIPSRPDENDFSNYELNTTENFVYNLIYSDLSKEYDTFIGYVPLRTTQDSTNLTPASLNETITEEAYGITYVDYEDGYIDETGKTYFSAGFISFPNEPVITQANINAGLEIVSLEEETNEEFSYVYTYNTEDIHMHCVIDNKYVKYDIVDGVLQYTEEPYAEGMDVDDSRGNIYNYDIDEYVYVIEEIDYVPVAGVSLFEQCDYQAIIDEVNRILVNQEINLTYSEIQSYIAQSQEALNSYILGLQEETFLGIPTVDLVNAVKQLDPMQHLQIKTNADGTTTIEIIEVTKLATLWEKICTTVICSCAVVGGITLSILGTPVFGGILGGAIIGAAMESFSQVVINNTPVSDIGWAQIGVAAVAGALAGGISGYLGGITTKGIGQLIIKETIDVLSDSLIGGTEFFVNSLIAGQSIDQAWQNFGTGVLTGAILSATFKVGSAAIKEIASVVKKADTSPYIITKVNKKAVNKLGKETLENGLTEVQQKTIQKNMKNGAKSSAKRIKNYFDDNGNLYRTGKNLASNTQYVKNGYEYFTDDIGRVTRATGDLRLNEGARASINASMDDIGKGYQLITDHRGHIIADRFGGSNDLDNLIAQNGKLNQGQYSSLENKWAKALKEGKNVNVDIKLHYKNNSFRPYQFTINYTIDGIPSKLILIN